ncbi:conjugal transfer protein [Nonomuraea indica]|uniref:conjugal transfer protein n=1 Tax=Nonomuraea indica TaxID=1581193 RepID=UPI001FE2C9D5|nr:conjugal transfer protein [Nonomuraea indica]
MTAEGDGFPTGRAMAFAAQFAGVYLNFSPDDATSRAGKLAAFLAEGMAPQIGWDGNGKFAAVAIQPYDIRTTDANNAVVSVAFQSGSRRLLLSVPIYYSGDDTGRFAVSGRPAILPAPSPAEVPQAVEPEADDVATAELKPQLEGFFQEYAKGDTAGLQRYLAAGKSLPSFGGAFEFGGLQELVVPVGGATREVEAVVVWIVPGASPSAGPDAAAEASAASARIEQAYRLTVEKQGDKWYVNDIRGAGRAVG